MDDLVKGGLIGPAFAVIGLLSFGKEDGVRQLETGIVEQEAGEQERPLATIPVASIRLPPASRPRGSVQIDPELQETDHEFFFPVNRLFRSGRPAVGRRLPAELRTGR